jgi:hypothetical protein
VLKLVLKYQEVQPGPRASWYPPLLELMARWLTGRAGACVSLECNLSVLHTVAQLTDISVDVALGSWCDAALRLLRCASSFNAFSIMLDLIYRFENIVLFIPSRVANGGVPTRALQRQAILDAAHPLASPAVFAEVCASLNVALRKAPLHSAEARTVVFIMRSLEGSRFVDKCLVTALFAEIPSLARRAELLENITRAAGRMTEDLSSAEVECISCATVSAAVLAIVEGFAAAVGQQQCAFLNKSSLPADAVNECLGRLLQDNHRTSVTYMSFLDLSRSTKVLSAFYAITKSVYTRSDASVEEREAVQRAGRQLYLLICDDLFLSLVSAGETVAEGPHTEPDEVCFSKLRLLRHLAVCAPSQMFKSHPLVPVLYYYVQRSVATGFVHHKGPVATMCKTICSRLVELGMVSERFIPNPNWLEPVRAVAERDMRRGTRSLGKGSGDGEWSLQSQRYHALFSAFATRVCSW